MGGTAPRVFPTSCRQKFISTFLEPKNSQNFSRTFGLCAPSSTHADRLAQIRRTWEEYLSWIRTLPGWVQVARQLREKLDGPVAVMETALPVKFEETIAEAVGLSRQYRPHFMDIEGTSRGLLSCLATLMP